MNNLYTEPTKDDLVYFAKRVIAALDVHCRGWRDTSPRCPTYADCAADTIRLLARGSRCEWRKARKYAEEARKRESRLIAHMAEVLSRTAQANPYTQTRLAQAAVSNRLDDSQGAAHGLRQHSIGSTYPCVVVGSIMDGVTYYHVEFGGYRTCKARDGKLVQCWAELIAKQLRIHGWEYAVDYLKGAYYYKGPSERRYD